MTVICAAVGPDGVWIAADSQCQAGDALCPPVDKIKIAPLGGWAYAAAGELTYDDALLPSEGIWPTEHGWMWPTKSGPMGLAQMMDYIRKALRDLPEFELVRDEGCAFADYRFSPVVASSESVWRLNSNLRSFDGPLEGVYQVAGLGADFAAGAMSALIASKVTSAELLVRSGVAAASRLLTTCGGEPSVVHVAPAIALTSATG